MTDITLSDEQNEALKLLTEEMSAGNPFVTLGGYAGSGKSTLIPYIAESLGEVSNTAFVTYTGKAAQVLREKLRAAGLLERAAYVGTIHGLIYKLVREEANGALFWERRQSLNMESSTPWNESLSWAEVGSTPIKRIFVDEVSMVGKKTLEDLCSYKVPILAVGDPAQLPPVNDESVLLDPDVLLTTVHRQARDNPIIRIATYVREHGMLPDDVKPITYDEAGDIVVDAQKKDPLDVVMLVRGNRARTVFNKKIYGLSPTAGSVVICLRNDWRRGLYNGLRGIVKEAPETWVPGNPYHKFTVSFPEYPDMLFDKVNTLQFGREKAVTQDDMSKAFKLTTLGHLFDFGTAMTVHKSQGSGFGTVLISPEHWKWNKTEKDDWKKWLYTAVTRASEKLYILPDW